MANSGGKTATLLVACLATLWVSSCSNVNEDRSLYPLKDRVQLELLDQCPKPDQENISEGAIIRFLFSKDLDPATVNQDSFMLGIGRELIHGDVYYEDGVVTYVPAGLLQRGTRYDFYITERLRDVDGFAYTSTYEAFKFVTGTPGAITCR